MRGTAQRLWQRWPIRQRVIAVGSVVTGVVASAVTGWLLLLPAIPLAVLGIPALLSQPPQRDIDLLAALDRWIRLLGPAIGTGKSIRDAIISTRSQAPGLLREPVARLVIRVDHGWSTHDVLLAMAEELDSADSDAVLAGLAIAATKGGIGARRLLTELGRTTQDRLHGLREIAAERAKPRAVVRQITLITLTVLGGAILLGGNFFEPYHSPLGQVIAASLALAYIGSLALLRHRTVPEPGIRFLNGSRG
ncbi:MAG: hypothetical protein CSA64_04350 [Arachnia propionica]|nr:MAG: hypothetical protein CSA64_04350 [Arachnia propionica]